VEEEDEDEVEHEEEVEEEHEVEEDVRIVDEKSGDDKVGNEADKVERVGREGRLFEKDLTGQSPELGGNEAIDPET
jgi:hypothetical protein